MNRNQDTTLQIRPIASDERLKKKIKDTGLMGAYQLPVYTFEYKEGVHPTAVFPKGTQIGHLAQEVQWKCPEAVTTDEHGFMCVNYALLYLHTLKMGFAMDREASHGQTAEAQAV